MGRNPFDLDRVTPDDFERMRSEMQKSRKPNGNDKHAWSFLDFVGSLLNELGMFTGSVAGEISKGLTLEVDEGASPDNVMRQVWNKQANIWAVIESPTNYFITMRTLLEQMKRNEHQRRENILSLGSGPGMYETYLGYSLKLLGDRRTRFICLDSAMEMTRCHRKLLDLLRVGKGRDLRPIDNVEPLTGDMMHLPFRSESIDQIICNNSLQWASDWRRAISEMARVMRPKGLGCLYLIVHLHPMAVAGEQGEVLFRFGDFQPDDLFDELERNRFEVSFGRQIIAPNGAGQFGRGINRLFVLSHFRPRGGFRPWREKHSRVTPSIESFRR